MISRLIAVTAGLVLALWMQAAPVSAQQAGARVGFVVGNAEYAHAPLATALNDAGLAAEALRSVGFDVIEGANLTQVDFVRSFRDFLSKLEAAGPDAVAFVYVSGYGFAFEGDNYLVAVDARLDRESDIPLETMRLSDIIRAFDGAPARNKVVVIDAARRLPFPLAATGLAPGLSAVAAPKNMLIGFSAAPGTVVADGAGPYGAYATAIAEMVRAAGLDLTAAFARIRARTHQLTEGHETPWDASALVQPAVLAPAEAAAVAPAPAMPAAARPRRPFKDISPEEAYAVAIERDALPVYVEFIEAYPRHPYAARIWAIIRARREALAWRRAVDINSPQSYWTYLQRYPNGIYAADAERRLHRLSAPFQPPPDFAPVEFADVPPPLPGEPVGIIDYYPPGPSPPVVLIEPRPTYFVDLPPPPPPVVRGGLPAVTALPVLPRVAPGVRIPVSVQSSPQTGRRLVPQGAAAVPPGPPPGVPSPAAVYLGSDAVAAPPMNGPPAPGSAPTASRPGPPADVAGLPPQPTPSAVQPGSPPAASVATPPSAGPTRAATPPPPSGPGVATAPAAGTPTPAPSNAPPRGRRQGPSASTAPSVPPAQVAPPNGAVLPSSVPPRPPRSIGRQAPPGPQDGSQPAAGTARPGPPPPAAMRPGLPPPPADAARPTPSSSQPQATAGPAANRRGDPPAGAGPPKKRDGKKCTVENGVEVCR